MWYVYISWYWPVARRCRDGFGNISWIYHIVFCSYSAQFTYHTLRWQFDSHNQVSLLILWDGREMIELTSKKNRWVLYENDHQYRQISNIKRTKSQNLNISPLVLPSCLPIHSSLALSQEWKDIIGATPTGDAPTTSQWSTIFMPKVPLILQVLWYLRYGLPDPEAL